MKQPTYKEIAEDYDLWLECVDPDGLVSEGSFNSMSLADKIAKIEESFGPEPRCGACGEVIPNDPDEYNEHIENSFFCRAFMNVYPQAR